MKTFCLWETPVPVRRTSQPLLPSEPVSRAYERHSLIVTTNLPFENWMEVCGCQRLTGAMLDRLTHRVHILEANGESYRLSESRRRLKSRKPLKESREDKSKENRTTDESNGKEEI